MARVGYNFALQAEELKRRLYAASSAEDSQDDSNNEWYIIAITRRTSTWDIPHETASHCLESVSFLLPPCWVPQSVS
jgi:hypothetical protein